MGKSKGRPCKQLGGRLCRLHTKRPGEPMLLSRACPRCQEWRCRSHCLCGRTGQAAGRSAPRPGRVTVAAPARPQAISERRRRPVGAPSAAGAELLSKPDWWSRCLADVAHASEVEIASYMFDEKEFCGLLAKRLGKRTCTFRLRICVDRGSFSGGVPRKQRESLRKLRELGAEVFLCKGAGTLGLYHRKGLVADRRYFYTGTANFTTHSRSSNTEWMLRIVGPMVTHAMDDLAKDRAQGCLWTGS